MKKWFVLFLTLFVLFSILFLTFQSANDTNALTYKAIDCLQDIGVTLEYKQIRHYIHYVLYFILGLVLATLFVVFRWKCWKAALLGMIIGVIDETIKIWLPIREFDIGDLIRDFVGIIVATFLVAGLNLFRQNRNNIRRL